MPETQRPRVHLAVDLGAESGRLIAVWLADRRALFHELHRFQHRALALPSGLHWNICGIWQEILRGLESAAQWAKDRGWSIQSVGVDAWGVDWALVDSRGELMGLPHAYRDPRNVAAYHDVVARIPAADIYRQTGIQLMHINSLFSLAAALRDSPQLIDAADRLLFIPDLIHYWLCGRMVNEQTIASTSQLVDCRSGQWSNPLLQLVGAPSRWFGDIVPAGTTLGTLTESVCAQTGLQAHVAVVAPASHDTASAVASVPAAEGSRWAFLSSGTWSLLGAELPQPCVESAAQRANFTNEGGVQGTTRFLKNIAGLWLVQECRRVWTSSGTDWSYTELVEAARQSAPWRTLVDPDDPRFQPPGDMPNRIAEFARATGQPPPTSPGEFVRCCLESLALAYRRTLRLLAKTLGQSFDVLHIVGGGSQNDFLNQLTADLCDCTVIAGPSEATALGNGLVQALACGELSGLSELRHVVASSENVLRRFQPAAAPGLASAIERGEAIRDQALSTHSEIE